MFKKGEQDMKEWLTKKCKMEWMFNEGEEFRRRINEVEQDGRKD